MQIALFKARPKDIAIFRCGGCAVIKAIAVNSKHRDMDIIFQGELVPHNYKWSGKDCEEEQSLFDIIDVQRVKAKSAGVTSKPNVQSK